MEREPLFWLLDHAAAGMKVILVLMLSPLLLFLLLLAGFGWLASRVWPSLLGDSEWRF